MIRYNLQKKMHKLQDEKLKLEEKRAKKRKKTAQSKTFVNSYGEATTRNITNSTYERNKKKRERQAAKIFMGI